MSDTALVGADYAWEPGTKITVTLTRGQTLRGVIWFADEIAVALEEARLWDGAQWVEQGEVVVPYSAIAFINRLPYKHTVAHQQATGDGARRPDPSTRTSQAPARPNPQQAYRSPQSRRR